MNEIYCTIDGYMPGAHSNSYSVPFDAKLGAEVKAGLPSPGGDLLGTLTEFKVLRDKP